MCWWAAGCRRCARCGRAFHSLQCGALVALFSAAALHELMVGSQFLDADALWAALAVDPKVGAPLQGWLRELVGERSSAWRKQLVRFVTGHYVLRCHSPHRSAEHAPISVKPLFPKAHAASDDALAEQLPEASTCACTLYLPPYEGRAALGGKLALALSGGGGFWSA